VGAGGGDGACHQVGGAGSAAGSLKRTSEPCRMTGKETMWKDGE